MTFQGFNAIRGNGAEAFQCAACGEFIAHSAGLILLNGKMRHVFVNPAGLKCDFQTFDNCPGAIALGEATEEYTWFPGYAWTAAFCASCLLHLGWLYKGVSCNGRPPAFWGILVERVITSQEG